MNDFFVGYLPVPPAIARFCRKVVVGLGVAAVALPLVLLRGQRPFASSAFEFGKARSFEGIIEAHPYPTLLVARPGQTGANQRYSRYLLVAAGKHGADSLIDPFDGRRVRLRGPLIYRAGTTMVEVEPGSIVPESGRDSAPLEAVREGGLVTLNGEIVDSKCFLGVMNPGSSKVHRDCASRCLSGGIPPIFITTRGDQFLLVGPDGRALQHDALREYVAEPITLTGMLVERGELRELVIDQNNLYHSSRRPQANLH